jgi:dipeptidase
LRSHFEGTSDQAEPPHDRAEDVDYTGESATRTLCTARTVISLVAEEDRNLPPGMMAKWWTAFPAPCSTGYFPIYLSHLDRPFPTSYVNAAADGTPQPDINAWWAYAELVSTVDQDYPSRQPAVRAAFDAFESEILSQVPSLEEDAAQLYSAGKAADADALLNEFTDDRATAAFEEAKRLTAEIRAPRSTDEQDAESCAVRAPARRPAGLRDAVWLALVSMGPFLRQRARRAPRATR